MGEVILYSNNCPRCNVIKTKLETSKIEFSVSNNTDELLNLGYQSWPVLAVGSNVMDFIAANNWVNERGAVVGN